MQIKAQTHKHVNQYVYKVSLMCLGHLVSSWMKVSRIFMIKQLGALEL